MVYGRMAAQNLQSSVALSVLARCTLASHSMVAESTNAAAHTTGHQCLGCLVMLILVTGGIAGKLKEERNSKEGVFKV